MVHPSINLFALLICLLWCVCLNLSICVAFHKFIYLAIIFFVLWNCQYIKMCVLVNNLKYVHCGSIAFMLFFCFVVIINQSSFYTCSNKGNKKVDHYHIFYWQQFFVCLFLFCHSLRTRHAQQTSCQGFCRWFSNKHS